MPETTDLLLAAAVAAHRAGQLANAEADYRRLLSEQQDHPDALHNLGVLAVQVGKPDAAIPLFNRACEVAPNNAQYWLSLADCLLRLGRPEDAVIVLEAAGRMGLKTLPIDALLEQARMRATIRNQQKIEASKPSPITETRLPLTSVLNTAVNHRDAGHFAEMAHLLSDHVAVNWSDFEALALLAQAFLLLQRNSDAANVVELALSLAPHNELVLRNTARVRLSQGQLNEAGTAARAAYAANPTNSENRLVMAALFLAHGDLSRALAFTESVLKEYPENPIAMAQKAVIMARQGQTFMALAEARNVVAIAPWLAQGWQILANTQLQLGDSMGALESLSRYCKLRPTDGAALADMGELLRRAGRLHEALSVLEQAVAIAPDRIASWLNYGTALQEARRTVEALAAYKRVLVISPNQSEVHNNMGVVYKERGDWMNALKAFECACQFQPDRSEYYANRGVALAYLDRLAEAAAVLEHASTLNPQSNAVLMGQAIVELLRKNLQKAESLLRQALEIEPENVEVIVQLGRVVLAEMRYPEASSLFDRALMLNPEMIAAIQGKAMISARQGNIVEAEHLLDRAIAIGLSIGFIPYEQVAHWLNSVLSAPNRRHELLARIDELKKIGYYQGPLASYALIHLWIEGNAQAMERLIIENVEFGNGKASEVGEGRTMLIFFNYLVNLYSNRESNHQKYNIPYDNIINIIGESHSLSPTNIVFQWGEQLVRGVPGFIIGIKMHHLASRNPHLNKVCSLCTYLRPYQMW